VLQGMACHVTRSSLVTSSCPDKGASITTAYIMVTAARGRAGCAVYLDDAEGNTHVGCIAGRVRCRTTATTQQQQQQQQQQQRNSW